MDVPHGAVAPLPATVPHPTPLWRSGLTGVSCAGLLLTVVLWVAGCFQASYLLHSQQAFVAVSEGSVWVIRYTRATPSAGRTLLRVPSLGYLLGVSPVTPERPFLFDTHRSLRVLWAPQFGRDICRVPLWMPLLLFGPLPLQALRRWWRRRRRKAGGLCLECGYDLRSSPEGCPECGTPLTAPAGVRELANGSACALPGDALASDAAVSAAAGRVNPPE